MADDGNVERLAIEREPDFGGLGRRLALVRLGLNELGGRHRDVPDFFVERAVNRDRRAGFDRDDDPAAILGLK